MKYALILIAFLSACHSTKKNGKGTDIKSPEEPVTLISAKSQNYAAGIPSGGYGTNYHIKVVCNTDDKPEFDSIWLTDRQIGLELEVNFNVNEGRPEMNAGDTVKLHAKFHKVDDKYKPKIKDKEELMKEEKYESEIAKPSVEFEGAALITYYVKGNVKYLLIPEFEKLPYEARP